MVSFGALASYAHALTSTSKLGESEYSMKQCPRCPCVFETEADYQAHMKAFGSDKEEHLRRFQTHLCAERGDSEYG